jgi:hypothetical protein
MRKRWQLILPVIGLLLFAGVSFVSLHRSRAYQKEPGRYLYWSSIRLDSDPLNKQSQVATPCENAEAGCVSWDPVVEWVSPGLLTSILMLSACPAFVIGMWLVRALGRRGVSEISGFMVLVPLLIFTWYYGVGWLIDCWIYKRRQKS